MDIRNQAILIDNLCAGLGSATTSEGILKAIYGYWGAKNRKLRLKSTK